MSNNIVSHGKRMVREDLIKKLLNGDFSVKLKDITNIQSLTDEQINELKAGDIVLKKTEDQTHTYIVSYKEENHGICISYFNAGYSETVSYDYIDGHWVYNSTDIVEEQAKLTAGDNIQINGNTISATDTTYTAGDGISIEDGVISTSGSSIELYNHNISITYGGSTVTVGVHITIPTPTNTPFTKTTFVEYLNSKYNNTYVACSGEEVNSNDNTIYSIVAIKASSASGYTVKRTDVTTGQETEYSFSTGSNTFFGDTPSGNIFA